MKVQLDKHKILEEFEGLDGLDGFEYSAARTAAENDVISNAQKTFDNKNIGAQLLDMDSRGTHISSHEPRRLHQYMFPQNHSDNHPKEVVNALTPFKNHEANALKDAKEYVSKLPQHEAQKIYDASNENLNPSTLLFGTKYQPGSAKDLPYFSNNSQPMKIDSSPSRVFQNFKNIIK
jgi:hypothetical protein